jgi:hypothetical protein
VTRHTPSSEEVKEAQAGSLPTLVQRPHRPQGAAHGEGINAGGAALAQRLFGEHQTQATVLLKAVGGNEQTAARVAQVLGWGRLTAAGTASELKKLLVPVEVLNQLAKLNGRAASASERADAVSQLRLAAVGQALLGGSSPRLTSKADPPGLVQRAQTAGIKPSDPRATPPWDGSLRVSTDPADEPPPSVPPQRKPAAGTVAPTTAPAGMPQGVLKLPPLRPSNLDLSKLPKTKLADAINVLETNSYPVSNPAYSAPADPLFATLFKALDILGSRTLTMGEMSAFVSADTDWAGNDLVSVDKRFAGQLDALQPLQLTQPYGISVHDLHKFIAGFRLNTLNPYVVVPDLGLGGEGGFIANITAVALGEGGALGWEREDVIEPWLRKEYSGSGNRSDSKSFWTKLKSELTGMDLEDLKDRVDEFVRPMSDPRDRERLSPIVKGLLASNAYSKSRASSARDLVNFLQTRDVRNQATSVSGLTAEIQMLQTLTAYLRKNNIDTWKAGDRIDWVAVFQLYREKLADGSLTTRETVAAWLKSFNVPQVP